MLYPSSSSWQTFQIGWEQPWNFFWKNCPQLDMHQLGASRDPMHLLPGALGQSRAGKVSIKCYCDGFSCFLFFFFFNLFLFQVKPNETHLLLEFEFYVQVWYLRYKFNRKTCSFLNTPPPQFYHTLRKWTYFSLCILWGKFLEIPQYFKIFWKAFLNLFHLSDMMKPWSPNSCFSSLYLKEEIWTVRGYLWAILAVNKCFY